MTGKLICCALLRPDVPYHYDLVEAPGEQHSLVNIVAQGPYTTCEEREGGQRLEVKADLASCCALCPRVRDNSDTSLESRPSSPRFFYLAALEKNRGGLGLGLDTRFFSKAAR